MYASYINIKLKPGKISEMKAITEEIETEIRNIGFKQFLVIDQGDNNILIMAIYESAAEQEAATPKAQAALGKYANLVAEAPIRKQVEVLFNY